MSQCLVFCRTNVDCNNLEAYLNSFSVGSQRFNGKRETGKENRYSCCVLAGKRTLVERQANLQALIDGDVRILICTDMGARGLDVKGLPFVVNMTLPDTPDTYVHRIGRVGRQNFMGLAISLVAAAGHKEKVWYHKCNKNNCFNRSLLSEGGCTVWYDEPQYLANIEGLIGAPVLEMNADLSLPQELKDLHAIYGEEVGRQEPVMSMHVAQLSGTVRELAQMEIEAQNIFLQLQAF
jgi:ATP-dependent RNA helicase DDX1